MASKDAGRMEEQDKIVRLEKGLNRNLSLQSFGPRKSDLLKPPFNMAVLTFLGCLSLLILYTTALPSKHTHLHSSPSSRAQGDLKLTVNHSGALSPSINADFPDPSVLQGPDGTWYSFATNGNEKHVQVAKANAFLGPWQLLDDDPLPDAGWTTGSNFWAPDVRQLHDGSYIMYYSGELPTGKGHCVGTARSKDIIGPYKPDPNPWVCHSDQGGAIDPSGFYDKTTGLRYVVYKIDGNAHGHGGDCNNGVAPLVSTPLMLQQVDRNDGSTMIGPAVQIMDRTQADGPLVEAPNLVRVGGRYVLFFSSHCYTDEAYDVKYAYADKVTGPYTRADKDLIATPDFGLTAPGGMTSTVEGTGLVFHAQCGAHKRCMYTVPYGVAS